MKRPSTSLLPTVQRFWATYSTIGCWKGETGKPVFARNCHKGFFPLSGRSIIALEEKRGYFLHRSWPAARIHKGRITTSQSARHVLRSTFKRNGCGSFGLQCFFLLFGTGANYHLEDRDHSWRINSIILSVSMFVTLRVCVLAQIRFQRAASVESPKTACTYGKTMIGGLWKE